MSDKESTEEKDVAKPVEEDIEEKGKKRKRVPKKAEPPKKKTKTEEPPVTQNNEEETDETEEDEKLPVALLDRSPEVTGTRIRKQVERLNINSPAAVDSPDRRKNELLPGKGVKLGASPKIQAQLQNVKQSDMVLLHRLLFKRPGTAHEIKKNIREFSGFPFSKGDKDFESRKHMLEKNTLNDLKFICQILCLEKSGTKESIIDRILEFCLCPDPSTKPVKKKSKKPKKNSKQKANSKTDDEKNSRASPKKSVVSSPTVEDSSSSSSEDEDSDKDDDDDSPASSPPSTPVKKTNKKAATPKTPKETPTKTKEVTTPKSKSKETPAPKSKKKTPKKSPKKAEIKIKLPPVNKSKKKLASVESNESEGDENKDTKEPKTENNIDSGDESSEDSSPGDKSISSNGNNEKSKEQKSPGSAKKTKKTTDPTNEEITSTIKQLLKDANLENMTMKNLCRQVYEKFPECDLEKTKKDFIRSTAKEILGDGV